MCVPAATVAIDLGERSYSVRIGSGELSAAGRRIADCGLGGRALVVTNPSLARRYGERLLSSLAAAEIDATLHTIPPGERAKRLVTVERICEAGIRAGLDRSSVMIALGGGVVGDVVGFAAATLYRGVALVQVPTTLVAMVDSSVGGKTGVNCALGKNLLGAFWQPALVLADLDTLRSLPPREVRCGLAEVIKHGCILDAALFERLETAFVERPAPGGIRVTARVGMDEELAGYCVRRSCELKGAVVAADEREAGQRAWLNFGHTFGHALEAVCGYGRLHHGEAVAIGMVLAARLGVRRGELGDDVRARLERLLTAVGLPTRVPRGTDPEAVLAAMGRDKKVRGGRLRLVLLKRLGEATVCADADPQMVRQVVLEAVREAEDGAG